LKVLTAESIGDGIIAPAWSFTRRSPINHRGTDQQATIKTLTQQAQPSIASRLLTNGARSHRQSHPGGHSGG
jgi:hypothetical protein